MYDETSALVKLEEIYNKIAMFDLFYEFEYINVINITNICFMYTLNELYDGKKIGLNKIVKS